MFFEIPQTLFFQVAGSISLAIPILSSIFKALIRRFYMVTDLNQPLVLKAMNLLSNFVIIVEIIILLSGAIVILPYLPSNIFAFDLSLSNCNAYCFQAGSTRTNPRPAPIAI